MLPSLNLGFVTLYLYPFFWGVAWASCYLFINSKLPNNLKIRNFFYFIIIFLCAMGGAKIFFLASIPSTFFENATVDNFSSGLGFVFYGGLIIGGLAVSVLSKLDEIWRRAALKNMLIVLPLGHAIGRLGCLFAGCCFGIHWDMPCCNINNDSLMRLPIPAIESIFLLILFYKLLKMHKDSFSIILSVYFIYYGVLRLCLELLRDDLRGHWLFLPPSLWISLLLIYSGVFLRNSNFKK